MKISVSSYSFSQMIRNEGLTQKDTIAKAKELGFDGIEFAEFAVPENMELEAYVRELAEETARVGIEVSNVAVGADFINKNTDDEVERVCRLVDMAALLGAKTMRHDATTGKKGLSFDAALPTLADACRRVAEYAQSKGVKTMVENHGFFCQDSDRMERLYNAVNHPNFGLLVDMGNFACADEDLAVAVGRVAPYAAYAHAKDFIIKPGDGPNPGEGVFRSRNGTYLRGTIVGQGNVPVQQCLTALKNAGYDGGITIEFEGLEHPMTGLRIGLDNLKRYIENA